MHSLFKHLPSLPVCFNKGWGVHRSKIDLSLQQLTQDRYSVTQMLY
ncbi:7545_t:CDS:2 [Paraglomus occultum]|uniref:7545_t:CDS:1 n=1 Tax=Paraglomus occultum TaxID=144539 RepID=A0A9N8ZRM6_9GLOM|nr:7545_t:CDS:2 [Paraglomus occultum]